MSAPLDRVAWPAWRAAEALEALAQGVGYAPREVEVPPVPAEVIEAVEAESYGLADEWFERAAAWLGVEAEPVEAQWADLEDLVATAAPAIFWLSGHDGAPPRLVAVTERARGGRVLALRPDLRVERVEVEALRAALCARFEAPCRASTRAFLTSVKVAPRRAVRAEEALVRERLGAHRVRGCWLLRTDPGEALTRQLKHAGAHRRLARMFVAQIVLYAVSGAGWFILGRGALQGTLDRAWLLGWSLTLLTTIPLQLMASWQGGFLALDAGAVFKRRLLAGAARLDPEAVRHQGAGGLLGRVIESTAVEQNALSGATLSIAAAPAIVVALAALAAGPGGPVLAAAFALWVTLSALFVVRYAAVRRAWTRARVAMTNDLVERMVGHRTRIAQESPERWHDGEDKAVERYVAESERLDRAQAALQVLVPRGWIVIGVALLAPALTAATASAATLAIGIGSVVFAGASLRSVTTGLVSLLSAGIAWREVAPLFEAAGRRDAPGAPLFAMRASASAPVDEEPSADGRRPIVEATDVVFRHEGRAEPVLRGVTLSVSRGDRILLEGPSGGGKSTLGAVLSGLRAPSSGLLLLHGLDARSVGAEAWRRRVVTAPQFHENHVMTGTLAFNLLLGRKWPPDESDLAEAEAVCRELELGPLLDRMPSGLQQMVGESGWRLSHGEQSRLFMARALLQGADVVVLDESFAALDPETLSKAMACALRRCPSLLVIAHP